MSAAAPRAPLPCHAAHAPTRVPCRLGRARRRLASQCSLPLAPPVPAPARLSPPRLRRLLAPALHVAVGADGRQRRGGRRRADEWTDGAGGGERWEVRRWREARAAWQGRVQVTLGAARGVRDAVADMASLVRQWVGRTRLTWLWFGTASGEEGPRQPGSTDGPSTLG
ncbi:hypothetical protein GUJ93_ZPchr0004g40073 [Zizania palustris]|uniref:Uncharacterized protein n=1 Tax=Zizania palustris TaxID=103762 RepID=A0A8J5V8P2_ZIZPA|nr:hypothetical protein GUJ93_ZPchr0004g40073 [Zizania palustris]